MSYRRCGAKVHGKAVKKLHLILMYENDPENPKAGPGTNKMRKKARSKVMRRQGKQVPVC